MSWLRLEFHYIPFSEIHPDLKLCICIPLSGFLLQSFFSFLFVLNSGEKSLFSGSILLKCIKWNSLIFPVLQFSGSLCCLSTVCSISPLPNKTIQRIKSITVICDKSSPGVPGPVTWTNVERLTWVGTKSTETMLNHFLTRMAENISMCLVVKAKC